MRRFFNGILKYRKVLIYSALTAFLCFLFLFAPRPNEEYCGKFIEVGNFGFFPLNCDSYDYIDTARSPVKLLEERSIRQTRPLYVVLASAVGYVLSPVVSILPLQRIATQDELWHHRFTGALCS
jgi:FtsH-binding integral membrane protein